MKPFQEDIKDLLFFICEESDKGFGMLIHRMPEWVVALISECTRVLLMGYQDDVGYLCFQMTP